MRFEFSPHIAVQVGDYQQAVEFYEHTMGMRVVERGDSESELRCGNITFYVEDNPERKLFLEFKVDDLPEAVSRLERAGCTISRIDVPEVHGHSYIVEDPYGLKFHVFQRSDPAGGKS